MNSENPHTSEPVTRSDRDPNQLSSPQVPADIVVEEPPTTSGVENNGSPSNESHSLESDKPLIDVRGLLNELASPDPQISNILQYIAPRLGISESDSNQTKLNKLLHSVSQGPDKFAASSASFDQVLQDLRSKTDNPVSRELLPLANEIQHLRQSTGVTSNGLRTLNDQLGLSELLKVSDDSLSTGSRNTEFMGGLLTALEGGLFGGHQEDQQSSLLNDFADKYVDQLMSSVFTNDPKASKPHGSAFRNMLSELEKEMHGSPNVEPLANSSQIPLPRLLDYLDSHPLASDPSTRRLFRETVIADHTEQPTPKITQDDLADAKRVLTQYLAKFKDRLGPPSENQPNVIEEAVSLQSKPLLSFLQGLPDFLSNISKQTLPHAVEQNNLALKANRLFSQVFAVEQACEILSMMATERTARVFSQQLGLLWRDPGALKSSIMDQIAIVQQKTRHLGDVLSLQLPWDAVALQHGMLSNKITWNNMRDCSKDQSMRVMDLLHLIVTYNALNDPLVSKCKEWMTLLYQLFELPPNWIFNEGVVILSKAPVACGGFGDVYKGSLRMLDVALKVSRYPIIDGDGNTHEKHIKDFFKEVMIWIQLRHNHILQCWGVTTEAFPDRLCVISTWAPFGDIHHYLEIFNDVNPLKLMHQAALGLHFLHTHNPVILHCDIKGPNILVDAHHQVKLCDFGLARFFDSLVSKATLMSNSNGSDPSGSLRWMAPELVLPADEAKPEKTKATDIYAFGMTLFEVYQGDIPFCGLSDAQVIMALFQDLRPLHDAKCKYNIPNKMRSIITACWTHIISERPDSDYLVSALATSLQLM